MEKPTRGDWASTCIDDLRQLGMTESLDEIQKMTKTKFNKILKIQSKESALRYLRKERKEKRFLITVLKWQSTYCHTTKCPSVKKEKSSK